MIPPDLDFAGTVPSNALGLSSEEAARRLAQSGPNAMADERERVVKRLARHFWAPVPWMLEATIVLQIATGKTSRR